MGKNSKKTLRNRVIIWMKQHNFPPVNIVLLFVFRLLFLNKIFKLRQWFHKRKRVSHIWTTGNYIKILRTIHRSIFFKTWCDRLCVVSMKMEISKILRHRLTALVCFDDYQTLRYTRFSMEADSNQPYASETHTHMNILCLSEWNKNLCCLIELISHLKIALFFLCYSFSLATSHNR